MRRPVMKRKNPFICYVAVIAICALDSVAAKPANAKNVELLLKATRSVFVEGADPSTDVAARMAFSLWLKNRSIRPILWHRVPIFSHGISWQVTDKAGGHWTPTFLPPPMPRPQRKRPDKVLPPGATRSCATLHGISGWRRKGRQKGRQKGRWYRVLPAGRYSVRVAGVTVGGIKRKLGSGTVTLRVLPADQPVRGLKLALLAARKMTRGRNHGRGTKPVTLTLVFKNTGKKTIRLDTKDLLWSKITVHVQGSYGSSKRERYPIALGPAVRVIKPGATAVFKQAMAFPLALGRRSYSVSPGWYQLSASYSSDKPGHWSGRVSSNVLWIEVRKPGTP